MSEDLLHRRFNIARSTGCNFAAVRLPQSNDVFFFYATAHPAMRRVDYSDTDRPVFVCSPYSAGNKAYSFVSDVVFKNEECIFGALPEVASAGLPWHQGASPSNFFSDEAFYQSYVNAIIAEIKNDRLDKVVAARCERVELHPDTDYAALFENACQKYPDACVYFFSTKDTGTWFGASPEKLLSVSGEGIETVALAGTLPAESENSWTDKEFDEQAMISFFIRNALNEHGFKNHKESDVSTLVAGNVKHLCTMFQAKAPAALLETKLHKFLNSLNPTPAVCGLPQFEASLFISANEKLERRFYSGFTGIKFPDKSMHLYVNLRCAELFPTHALLYAGAGITDASVAASEWAETNRKLNTLKNILV